MTPTPWPVRLQWYTWYGAGTVPHECARQRTTMWENSRRAYRKSATLGRTSGTQHQQATKALVLLASKEAVSPLAHGELP